MIAQTVQTVEAFGIPYTESRYELDVVEIPLITLEFAPKTHPLDDYGYFQPEFVFGDVVALKEQYDYCRENQSDFGEKLEYFRICAMELKEPRNSSGRLSAPPCWLYGIRCDSGTRELLWFEEAELISKRQIEQDEEDLNEF